jgi:hypothetical protein
MNWTLIFWTMLLLIPLLWLMRRVHEGLQELFYLLTAHKTAAIYLFQILLLPGVLLHEFSHYLIARLLGVRVRKVSLQPVVQGDKIQMGAVVIERADFIRGLLIGMAPLVLGSIAVVLIGQQVFDVSQVIHAAQASDSPGVIDAIRAAFGVNDAWIWLYLIFAISNAMLPSKSDRESLWPMVAFITLLAVVAAIAGWGLDLVSSLAKPVETALSLLLVAFGITVFVDAIFLGVITLLRGLISLLTGRKLEQESR